VPHPISQPEAQTAQEQKAEDDSQLRSRAQRYLGIALALFEFLGFLNFWLVVVKVSAHNLVSTPLNSNSQLHAASLYPDFRTGREKLIAKS
jgi:hypothetical protein